MYVIAARRVERAQILLACREKPSFFAVGQRLGLHHQTVQRCLGRALAYGPLTALDDRPRPGKEPTITPEAKAWLVSQACDKAKDRGYPHELWTTRLLARHARENASAAGHQCLAKLVQGTVCKILGQEEIKPHKVRYYLERRDVEFAQKMAEVLWRLSRGPGPEKGCEISETAPAGSHCLLRPKNQESRPLQRPRPICRPSPASTRLWRAIMSTNGMVRQIDEARIRDHLASTNLRFQACQHHLGYRLFCQSTEQRFRDPEATMFG
jgi:hypothetical protein